MKNSGPLLACDVMYNQLQKSYESIKFLNK